MKRIEVEERVYSKFEDYRGNDEDSRALGRLLRTSNAQQQAQAQSVAVVILEGHWFDFDSHPGQVSNAPFLEGVCRLANNVSTYRLNFYDAGSFSHALKAAETVSASRVILYIGAHGSKGRVAAANSTTLMKQVADFSRKKKVEGILLSACLAGGNDAAMDEALKGGSNWIFGYRTAVDFLGSVQVEAAILSQLLRAEPGYADDEDEIIELFGTALHCFNPDWEIGEGQYEALHDAIRLKTRGKRMKTAMDFTDEVIEQAWPAPAPARRRSA